MKRHSTWTLLLAVLGVSALLTLAGCSGDEDADFGPLDDNTVPQISELSASPQAISADSLTTLSVIANDPDGDTLSYEWSADGGAFPDGVDSSTVVWRAPTVPQSPRYHIRVAVMDGKEAANGEPVATERLVEVIVDRRPASPQPSTPSDSARFVSVLPTLRWSEVTDPEGDPISYNLYLGNSPTDLTERASGLSGGEYTVSSELLYGSRYYWMVTAIDDEGYETPGTLRSFTTVWNSGDFPAGPAQGDVSIASFGMAGNVDTLSFVFVAPASFTMGSSSDDPDADTISEGPPHQVSFSSGYWMAVRELDIGTWANVMGVEDTDSLNNDSSAVGGVSWSRAKAFVSGLNQHEAGSPWALPSEAQWEYAARAGQATRFPWGDDLDYDSLSVFRGEPNPFGISGLYGSRSEWCEDDWHSSYLGAPVDGTAWKDNPRAFYRVLRGAASGATGPSSRPAHRIRDFYEDDPLSHGVRLVRRP